MRNYHNCEKTSALSVLFRASFSASKSFVENAPLQPESVVPARTLEVRLPVIHQSGATRAGAHSARLFSAPPRPPYHLSLPSRAVYLLLLLYIFHTRADR